MGPNQNSKIVHKFGGQVDSKESSRTSTDANSVDLIDRPSSIMQGLTNSSSLLSPLSLSCQVSHGILLRARITQNPTHTSFLHSLKISPKAKPPSLLFSSPPPPPPPHLHLLLRTIIIALEPCALDAEFQHFILRLIKFPYFQPLLSADTTERKGEQRGGGGGEVKRRPKDEVKTG
jgi:hypothetical protein